MSEGKTIYSNSIGMNISLFDFTLQFNLVNIENKSEIIDSCRVFLSPQHAKALLIVLEHNIKLYEEQFKTTISIPENIKDILTGKAQVPPKE